MKKIISLVLMLCLFTASYSAVVDTLSVHSSSMRGDVNVLVITPEGDSCCNKRYPVIYLLHGHGGDHMSWARSNDLNAMADANDVIIVCPDGKTSWYWDSPLNPKLRFETFISRELPGFVDAKYSTVANREGRAITGLSMGGHGAMWNAIRNKDVFAAAGSMSGGVDVRPFPESWNMKDNIGPKSQYPDNWENFTVINQIDSINNGDLALIVDCGYDDFFFDVNNAFHLRLLEKGIGHDYIVRPGRHDWKYWRNAVVYQMMFFRKNFDRLIKK